MKFKYAVTYEFSKLPPITARGTVASTGAHTAASRAVKAARKGVAGRKWSSLVVVLEREVEDEKEEVLGGRDI